MAARNNVHQVREFGGLVLNRPPSSLQAGEAVKAKNLDLSNGTIKVRSGWAKFGTMGRTNPAHSLYYTDFSTTTPRMFAIADNLLFYNAGSSWVSVGSVPSGAWAQYRQTQDILYLALETPGSTAHSLKKYTPSGGLSDLPGTFTDPDGQNKANSIPKGGVIATYADRLWVGGGTTGSRLYWSYAFPFQDGWDADAWVDLLPGDGDSITGAARLGTGLIVFKQRSVHRITGSPPDDPSVASGDLEVFSFEGEPGCVAPATVSTGRGVVVYLNRRGVFAFDGMRSQELTQDVRPLFDDINEAQLSQASGAFIDNNHYVVSIPRGASTKPDLTISIRFEPSLTVSTWEGFNAYSWSVWFDNGNPVPMFGTDGEVAQMNGAVSDNSKPIHFEYQTGKFQMGAGPFPTTIRRGWLWHNQASNALDVEMLPDHADQGVRVTLDMGLVAARGEGQFRRLLPAFGTASSWSLRLSGRALSKAPEVFEVALETTLRRRP